MPAEARAFLAVIHVQDDNAVKGGENQELKDDQTLASIFGAAQVRRNSLQMVESAFDGCVLER